MDSYRRHCSAVLVVFAVQRLHPDVDHMLYPRKYGSIVKKRSEGVRLAAKPCLCRHQGGKRFRPRGGVPVGALGLMQMMPETFDWMQTHIGGEYDASALLDPRNSIKYGCALLRVLLNEYDNSPQRSAPTMQAWETLRRGFRTPHIPKTE